MAQKPARRHVLAQIRIEAGLSQEGLASVLGCSLATVQRIEQATLPFSEKLASKAQTTLDISASWLLANDSTQPPVTPDGILWNRFVYEFAQGHHLKRKEAEKKLLRRFKAIEKKSAEREFDNQQAKEAGHLIRAMLEGARGSPKHEILVHRLHKMLAELKKGFPPDEKELKRQLEIERQTLRDREDAATFRTLERIEPSTSHFTFRSTDEIGIAFERKAEST